MSDAAERPLRILVVSPLMAPLANAEGFVGAKMALALRGAGADVRVLYDGGFPASEGMPLDASPAWRGLEDVSEGLIAPSTGRLKKLARLARYGASDGWIGLVLERARAMHAERPFDVVFSRSVPRRAHVAGYWCSRALGARWAVSINDPWEYFFAPEYEGPKVSAPGVALAKAWLRRALRRADLLCCPCPRLAEFTKRLVSSDRAIQVLPHIGWARPALENGDSPREAGTVPVFRLVHAGYLGIGRRRPDELLGGLREFFAKRPDARPRTRLTFIGPFPDALRRRVSDFALDDVVACTGRVGYEESLRWIASAAVCVLVEAVMEEGIYLPSKFADYMAAGKPVLALSPRVGTIADFLPDPGVLRVDADDVEGIAAGLSGLYDEFVRNRLETRRPSERLTALFEPERVARRFLECMARATRG